MSEAQQMLAAMQEIKTDFKEYCIATEKRLRILEDWKLSLTTKISIYVGIGTFLGLIVGQIAAMLLNKYL